MAFITILFVSWFLIVCDAKVSPQRGGQTEHLSAFFKRFTAQTTKTVSCSSFRITFSDEEREEMVLFFTIDFHATIALGNVSVAPANSRSHRRTLYFITLVKVR